MSEILKQQIAEARALRAKAPAGRLVYGPSELHDGRFYSGFVVGKDPSPKFQINTEAHFSKDGGAEFHVHAANNIERILSQLEIAVETLELFKVSEENQNRLDQVDLFTAVQCVRHADQLARQALKEMESLVTKSTENVTTENVSNAERVK